LKKPKSDQRLRDSAGAGRGRIGTALSTDTEAPLNSRWEWQAGKTSVPQVETLPDHMLAVEDRLTAIEENLVAIVSGLLEHRAR
jgi:hypothetical protein